MTGTAWTGKGWRRMAVLGVAGLVAGAALLGSPAAEASQFQPPIILRYASGADAASIQGAVDAFRNDLGANNGVGGSFDGGRREINWDGVPDAVASPNALPGNFFNVNSPRGAVFTTPGSGFEVSARAENPAGAAVRFGNINPSYSDEFQVFSPQRLFTAVGSTVTDVHFFLPGTNTPATVAGFGVVFTDVDITGAARVQYFNSKGRSLGTFVAPASPDGGLSFVGVSFTGSSDEQRVARVRITSGLRALSAHRDDSLLNELVVMDDFIYGEPRVLAPKR